jgi:hypothetical protein
MSRYTSSPLCPDSRGSALSIRPAHHAASCCKVCGVTVQVWGSDSWSEHTHSATAWDTMGHVSSPQTMAQFLHNTCMFVLFLPFTLGSALKSHFCDLTEKTEVIGLSDLMTLFIDLGSLYRTYPNPNPNPRGRKEH